MNWMFYQMIPANMGMNRIPPTLYSILNSIVNGEKEEYDYSKIKDLAKLGRTTIFNFDYELSENISKEEFETTILNHFLMRRIGFETVTAFRIQLNVKLQEIMPIYNKIFDSFKDWNILNDGEKTIRDLTDNNNVENELENKTNDISDRRFSDTPEDELENIRDGKYATTYNYDTGTSNSNSNGKSKSNQILHEEITRSPADKIAILKEMQENIKSVYTMIFKDLDCLFYQLV